MYVYFVSFRKQHTQNWAIGGALFIIIKKKTVGKGLEAQDIVSVWPKPSLGFFCNSLRENPNELFGQPNTRTRS